MKRSDVPRVVVFLLVCTLTVLVSHGNAHADDWPNWRGPQQNRVSKATDLIAEWDPDGGPDSNVIWKNEELGGRSTPVVMNGRLYTIARDKPGTSIEGSKVVCVDAATGEPIWEHRFNVYLTDVPDTRVGWSSVCGDPETGRVYALSVSGYFCCLDGETGYVEWERSLHEEFGLLSTYGGRTHSPIIFEDTVIISAVIIGWGDAPQWGFLAKPAHRFLCFDKRNGKLRWLKGTGISPYDTTYSTPTITMLGDQMAMVFGSGDGEIWALQPRTGERIWHYPFSRRGVNASPLIVGDTVYASHSEENILGNTMGSVVALDGTMKGDLTGKEKWQVFELMVGKASPVMVDGRLWVIDDRAKLNILDPETGNRVAKKALGTVQRSTPLVADGKVFTCTHNGRWYVLQPTEKGVKVLHKLRLRGEASDGSPIAVNGRVYFPTSSALYCLGTASTDPEPESNLPPRPSMEEPTFADDKPVLLQVVPYDTLLAPGESVSFNARLYNSRGQLLSVVLPEDVKFSVTGAGEISGSTYSASNDSGHECALITCTVGDLQGTARVRVVPPLPWNFDFNTEPKVPLTWVGGRVRWVIRDVDGEKIGVKRDVLPTPRDPNNKLGTRSRMWMGSIEMANYTIQSDFALQSSIEPTDLTVQAAPDEPTKVGKMSDFGLINSRYTMTVRSSNKELRIYSWSPHDYRTYASVPFDPEPGKWYTMKLEVTPQSFAAIGSEPTASATVRGKLWVRGEKEPDDWTVEIIDESPNLTGSPGLYGNAQEAEIYIDNVSVVANE